MKYLQRTRRAISIKIGLRCCGDCCRKFPLSASLDHIKELAKNEGNVESRIVVDMIIPLGKVPGRDGVVRDYYACRHLKENGDCGNYLGRPLLCKDYPYGKKCEHDTCNWRWWEYRRLVKVAFTWVKRHLPRFRKRGFLIEKADGS